MAKESSSKGSGGLFHGRFADSNGTIIFIMIYMASCSFNFGYDVGNFSGVQGMESFGRKFGEYDESKGRWALPAWLSSLMTSLPFLGKALGAIACGWVAERWGRRMAVLTLVIQSFIGVLLQTSATTSAQFIVGRLIAFSMTGFTIVVVPIYQAETAPKSLRGMLNSTLQLMIMFGQLIASLVVFGTQHMTTDAGWQIPVGLQFIAPSLILSLLPFVPESPRWLLAKHRLDDARKALQKLRKGASSEEIDLEIEALRHANSNAAKGTWAEVFNKQNRVRTGVAVLAMFGQQITGQAFVSQYSVIFYQQQGFSDKAFVFNIAYNVVSVACVVITWYLVDALGRRPLLLIGGCLMASFLYIVGGVATNPDPPIPQREAMVASVILFGAAYSLSWAPISYVVVSEAAASRIKEKTNLLACVISVLTTFVTSFTIPYLLDDAYAGLGGKIGFVYGSICWAMALLAFLWIPELKGRSLEEVDQLFASRKPLRKFESISTVTIEESYREEVLKDNPAAKEEAKGE